MFWDMSIVSSFLGAIGEMKFSGDPKVPGSRLGLWAPDPISNES